MKEWKPKNLMQKLFGKYYLGVLVVMIYAYFIIRMVSL